MQMGFYFDQTRCTGCFTCVVACKDWHDVPAGPASWRRVKTIEEGKYPNPFVAFLATYCYHCAKPGCVPACPVGAITKDPANGVMTVNQELCLGKDCSACRDACPYEAPQFRAEDKAAMEMCNFCPDKLAEGKKPICVDGCPMRALDAGPLDELKTKYGETQDAVGFSHSAEAQPSIVFKSKRRPQVA